MHEILNSFKWKPIPKFQQLINFKKPQNLRFKTWNAWIMRDKKLSKWGKTWKSLRKPWGLNLEWDESVWERKWESYRERDRRKWAVDRTRRLYKPPVNLDRCRYRDSYRGRCRGNGRRQIQVSRRCRGTIHQMQEQKLDLSISCWEAIEEARAFLIYPPSIEKQLRLRYEKT